MRRLSDILKFCFAWPIVHAIDMISYVREQEGWVERMSAALVMLPGYVISTLFWLMIWALTLAELFDLG